MNGRVGATAKLNAPVARILNKYDLFVHPDDESLTPCLLRDGYWESWITSWVMKNVEKDTVFFDIGAHCGYYTMIAADLVGPRGHVQSFEPNPELAQLIVDSAEANGFKNIKVWPKAVSRGIGSTTLYLPKRLMGSASTMHDFEARHEARKLRVPVEPLSHFLIPFKPEAPITIKIDAEGAEEEVVESGIVSMTYRDNVTLVLEYTPNSYSPEFLPMLHRLGEVRLLDYHGREQRVSDDWIQSRKDWITLVVRHKR